MGKSSGRNMGLECLRIFSMFLIILLHSIDHSGLLESLVPGTPIYYCEKLLYALTRVCVNCFVMISGYFLVKSKFRISKLLILWIEVVFYSVLFKAVAMATGEIPFSLASLASCFAPFVTGRYWFVTIYFGLYLISPFLNIAINAMTQKQFGRLNLVLFIIGSVMVSLYPAFKGMNFGGGWGLAWFVILYLCAAYLRLYGIPWKKDKPLFWLTVYLVSTLCVFGGVVISDKLGMDLLKSVMGLWHGYDSVPMYIGSIALFCAFAAWENKRVTKANGTPNCPKWISTISAATFGVYLIHAHADICIPKYWQMAGILSMQDTGWLYPLYQIGLVLAIFAVCVVLDLVREWLFKLLRIGQLTNFIGDKLTKKEKETVVG